jgi:hypothetical protein
LSEADGTAPKTFAAPVPLSIRRKPDMTNEPKITINGRELTEAQAMTIRVAVSAFLVEMSDDDALGGDQHGIAMARAYWERCTELVKMMEAN